MYQAFAITQMKREDATSALRDLHSAARVSTPSKQLTPEESVKRFHAMMMGEVAPDG